MCLRIGQLPLAADVVKWAPVFGQTAVGEAATARQWLPLPPGIIEALRASGVRDLRSLASALNSRGVRTARGARWHVSNTKNLVDRLPIAEA